MNPGSLTDLLSPLTAWAPLLVSLTPLALLALLLWPRAAALVGALAPWTALPALLTGLLAPDQVLVLPGLMLGSSLQIDPVGRVFLVALAILWLAAGWLAGPRLRHRRTGLLLLLAMSGSFGLAVAGDLVTLLLASTLTGYALYGLAVGRRGASALVLLLVLSDLLLFELLLLLVKAGAGVGLAGPAVSLAIADSALLLGLVVLGFGAKAALVGLHYWLPPLLETTKGWLGPPLLAFVLGAGLLPWLRLLPGGEQPWTGSAQPLAWSALTGIGAAALLGLLQRSPGATLGYLAAALSGFWLLLLANADPLPGGDTRGAEAALALGQGALALAALATCDGRTTARWSPLTAALNAFGVLLLTDAVLASIAHVTPQQVPLLLVIASTFLGLPIGHRLVAPIITALATDDPRALEPANRRARVGPIALVLALSTAAWAIAGTGSLSIAAAPIAVLALAGGAVIGALLAPLLARAPRLRLPAGDLAIPLGRALTAFEVRAMPWLDRRLSAWRDALRMRLSASWPSSVFSTLNERAETLLRSWLVAMILLLALMLLTGLLLISR
jgi:formate hydrogenlyase subunit 3/multisubunit Na+/H+ antiporter MnhD subunit